MEKKNEAGCGFAAEIAPMMRQKYGIDPEKEMVAFGKDVRMEVDRQLVEQLGENEAWRRIKVIVEIGGKRFEAVRRETKEHIVDDVRMFLRAGCMAEVK